MAKSAKNILKKALGNDPTFGMALRSYRTLHNLTQAELANILDYTVSHISDLENSRKLVSVEKALLIANKLKDNEKFYTMLALKDQVKKAGRDWEVEVA